MSNSVTTLTVQDARKKMQTMSLEKLQGWKDEESDGKKRSSLLASLDSEIEQRGRGVGGPKGAASKDTKSKARTPSRLLRPLGT